MAILAYHKVDNKFELGLTNVTPKMFERQVAGLKQRGVNLSLTAEEAAASSRAVYLTFDDGYDCFYRNVAPLLLRVRAKATVFVISDYVGKENEWDLRLSYKRFRHMNAAQLREVAAMGFVVGSHSCSHKDLTRLDRKFARDELRNSKMEIEDLIGREVEEVSFPFGRYDHGTIELAKEVGYKKFYGLGSTGSPNVFGRIPVYRIDTPSAVRRKVEMNRYEILKSDFVHSFAVISALILTRKQKLLKGEN